MEKSKFTGFPKQILHFYSQLAQNNNREWFLSHKKDYETYVVIPSCTFILAMGNKLKKISKNINAIPKINKSLFRIHRDIRFAQNKSPYRNTLHILFWEGTKKKRTENPGFFVHLEKRTLFLGTGLFEFSPELLKKYRNKLSHISACKELHRIISKLNGNTHFEISGKKMKRNPSGFPVHDENKILIKYKGLYSVYKTKITDIFYKPGFIDFCYEKFFRMASLHKWIKKL